MHDPRHQEWLRLAQLVPETAARSLCQLKIYQKHQTHPDPQTHKLRIGVDSTKPTWFSSVGLSNFRHGSERLFRESRGCTSILQTAKPNHRSERKQRWTGCLECFAALNLPLSSLPLFCAFFLESIVYQFASPGRILAACTAVEQ